MSFPRALVLVSIATLASPASSSPVASSQAAPQRPSSPCPNDPLYRALDYWVGAWDVYPTGQPRTGPASENVVTSEYEGCVIQEHWKGADGSAGTSFNLYDRVTGKWTQVWVDSTGRLAELRGGPDAQGNLVYYGERPPRPGEKGPIPTRLSFLRLGPDSVRQLGEASKDGGKTWAPTLDLTYYRRGGTGTPVGR